MNKITSDIIEYLNKKLYAKQIFNPEDKCHVIVIIEIDDLKNGLDEYFSRKDEEND